MGHETWIVGAVQAGSTAVRGMHGMDPSELEHADAWQNLAVGHEHQGELPDVLTGDVVAEREASDRIAPVWVTQMAKAKRAPIPSTQKKAARTPARAQNRVALTPDTSGHVAQRSEGKAGGNQHRHQREIVASPGYGAQLGDGRPVHQPRW